jgi:Ankyrin repeats (3 copies)
MMVPVDIDNDVTFGVGALAKNWVENGGDPDAETGVGGTLLHLAASYGRYDLVSTLLEKGAKVNAQDKYKYTPLHEAAGKGRASVVRLLLLHGADPSLRHSGGLTAEDMARVAKKDEVIKALMDMRTSPTKWLRTGDDEICQISEKKAIGYKLTQIFNFSAETCIGVMHNEATKAESSFIKTFDEMAGSALLGQAEAELLKNGGKLPDTYISRACDKEKPRVIPVP